MPSAKMKKIAEEAGVSVTTVSLALRNHPRISAKTKKVVHRIAKKMGYKPDPEIAKLMGYLRSKKLKGAPSVVAFLNIYPERNLLYDIQGLYDFFIGAKERARILGYALEEFWLKEPGMTGKRMSQILRTRGITGLLVGPRWFGQRHIYLEWEKFSAVSVGEAKSFPRLHSACNNQYHSMELLLRKAIKFGYQKIGLALVMDKNPSLSITYNYLVAFHHFKVFLSKTTKMVAWLPEKKDFTKQNFLKWVNKTKPDLIISLADIYPWLSESNFKIPKDIGYAILSQTEETEHCAGIDQNGKQVGAAAMDQLHILLQTNTLGIPQCPQVNLIEGRWVSGKTMVDKKKATK